MWVSFCAKEEHEMSLPVGSLLTLSLVRALMIVFILQLWMLQEDDEDEV